MGSPRSLSSLGLSSTWPAAPWLPWSGRDSMLSRLAVLCWEPPTLLTLLQEPSGEISAFRLDVTSATALTLSSPPTRRSLSGLSRRSSAAGGLLRRTGSTSNSSLVPGGFYLQATHYHNVLLQLCLTSFMLANCDR